MAEGSPNPVKTVLKIVLAQVETTADPAANLDQAARLARQAADGGAHLMVLPEMYMGLPGRDRPPALMAARDQGAFGRGLASLARDTSLFIICGIWEPGPDPERAYNTARVVSPRGQILADYRKLHLFDALNLNEPRIMAPGRLAPPVVPVAGVRLGLAICYDLRFPELFRHLAGQGAELIVVPSAWYAGPMKETHWLTLLRARAIENTCYVAGCDLAGAPFAGCSAVFDPFGVLLGAAGEAPGLVAAEVDLARLAAVRRKLPALAHRRTDLFPR